MWIVSTKGFYSIVQKPWDVEKNTLTVRSRVYSDLNAFRKLITPTLKIKSDDKADYSHRLQAPQADVAEALAKMARTIRYDNFKDAVDIEQGHERAELYAHVWQLLIELEGFDDLESNSTKRKGADRCIS